MLLKTVRGFLGRASVLAASLAIMSTLGLSPANAQNPDEGNIITTRASTTAPRNLTLVVGGGLTWNFANTREEGYRGAASEPPVNYAAGEYNTFSGHVGLEIPLSGIDWFMFAPRVTYRDLSAVLDDDSRGQTVPTSIAYDYRTIGLDILGKIAMGNFHVLVGPYIGESYGRKYQIAPTGPNLVGPSPTSAADNGENMDNVPELFFSVGAGMGYDIPLNSGSTVWLTPELSYNYPITNLGGSGGDLIVQQLKGALSLKFDLAPAPAPVVPPPSLAASIRARGVMPDGSIADEPALPQQALHSRSSMPLLPYVFFEMGEAGIPARYSRMGQTGFSTATLQGKEAIDANHALLDIVGMRMKTYPNARITITGTNSNAGVEKANVQLSKNRAQAVADYLTSTWQIPASSITVDQRNLPEIPTNPVTKAGMEENRRVEIASNDARIVEPVKLEERSNVSVGETVVRFETSVTPSNHPFTSWKITMDQNGTAIGQGVSGSGAPPAVVTYTVPDASRWANQAVHYKLEATDASGRMVNADGMTRIVPRTVDRENLERFAMLSFDFDRSEINGRARQMLELVSESVSRDATGVAVNGYCDNTGTDEYNQALSEARANSAVSSLRSMTKLPTNVNVTGHGERDPKFSNDLPEGRQLNRRVEFTIEKSSR